MKPQLDPLLKSFQVNGSLSSNFSIRMPEFVGALMGYFGYLNVEIDFGEFCQLMGKCEDGQFNVGTSVLQGAFKNSLGLEKIKKQVDELVREATDKHGRKLGYKNLPHGVSDLTLHATKPFPSLEATFLGEILVGTPYEGRLLRLRISGDHCYPVSPPRVAFTRRVIHLNFDVAPSGETFVSQLLNTWSGVCDVKWLLDLSLIHI